MSELSDAVVKQDVRLVEQLLTHGADPNVMYAGSKLIHYAVATGNPEIVKPLLGAGADVNALNEHQQTPLHPAARRGRHHICALLAAHGADINARDRWGRTPLHYAAIGSRHIDMWWSAEKQAETVQKLIDLGAEVNAVDNDGRTPLTYAYVEGYKYIPPEIFRLLRQLGATGTDEELAHLAVMKERRENRECLIGELRHWATILLPPILLTIFSGPISVMRLWWLWLILLIPTWIISMFWWFTVQQSMNLPGGQPGPAPKLSKRESVVVFLGMYGMRIMIVLLVVSGATALYRVWS